MERRGLQFEPGESVIAMVASTENDVALFKCSLKTYAGKNEEEK